MYKLYRQAQIIKTTHNSVTKLTTINILCYIRIDIDTDMHINIHVYMHM